VLIQACMPSFDIAAQIDKQELDNALNQARKEVTQRYDLKNAHAQILFQEESVTLIAQDDYKVKAVLDILQSKLIKRGISLKAFQYGPIQPTAEGQQKQILKLQQGIPQEKAHAIVKTIKGLKLKVQSQIQGDQIRVTGKKIDDLQAVIQTLRTNDHGIYMDFVNMKT